jgi:23S rRNA (uracil1939-C5)-methyltransferase
MLKKGQLIEIEIEKNIFGGEGLGRFEGMPVFVPESVEEDRVLIELVSVNKSYARGVIKKIIENSPKREKPKCIYFDQCGGCDFMMVNYNEQLKLKKKMVEEVINKIGKSLPEDYILNDVLGSDSIDFSYFYRNKVIQPFGTNGKKIISGFYKKRTHEIIDSEKCIIQSEISNKIIKKMKEITGKYGITTYNEKTREGLLRNVMVRVNRDGDAMVVFILNSRNEKGILLVAKELKDIFKEIKSIYVSLNCDKTNIILGEKNILVTGEKFIIETLNGIKFNISPLSFFQVNLFQTEKLYNTAINYFEKIDGKVILDAYSGTGTIGMITAKKASYVYCVEENSSATSDAERAAEYNSIKNIEFITGKMEEKIYEIINNKKKIDGIIFDPPRSGISENILIEIAKCKIAEIVYISCNPSTFARDVEVLKRLGYKLKEVTPVDMFPHTHHIEIVAKIILEDKN